MIQGRFLRPPQNSFVDETTKQEQKLILPRTSGACSDFPEGCQGIRLTPWIDLIPFHFRAIGRVRQPAVWRESIHKRMKAIKLCRQSALAMDSLLNQAKSRKIELTTPNPGVICSYRGMHTCKFLGSLPQTGLFTSSKNAGSTRGWISLVPVVVVRSWVLMVRHASIDAHVLACGLRPYGASPMACFTLLPRQPAGPVHFGGFYLCLQF